MITYNNIISRFEKFVAEHFFLKTFTHGSPSGVDLEKFEVYPAMHVVYTGSTYENTSKEYSFEVYILDLPPDKAKRIDNQTQLVSNAEQVAEDILADMRNGDNVFDFGHLYTVTSASTTTLEETTSNSLAGVLLNISIEVGYTLDSCNAPMKTSGSSGSEIPSGGGGTISTIHYTTDTNTNIVAGSNSINLPTATDPTSGVSVWNTADLFLRKSVSFQQNFVNNRHEITGLNSNATVSIEVNFDLTAIGAGVWGIVSMDSGVFMGISESITFAAAGTKSITLSGSGLNSFSNYMFNAFTILGNVSGTATLKSVSFTINNKY